MANRIHEMMDLLPTAGQEDARSGKMKRSKDLVSCSRYLHTFDQENVGKLKQSLPLDLVKDIFLRLPLKSMVKFKTLSKEWRSILESPSFMELHLNFQKYVKRHRKILAAYNCDCCGRPNLSPELGSEGDEEIVYLHCNTSRPLMSCDGLVCLPEPGWVNVMNPSTGELVRFPSGPDPVPAAFCPRHTWSKVPWLTYFPGFWSMGFGRDKVTGSYKVVRMIFDPLECDVLTVGTNGQWRRKNPPPYRVDTGRRSTCVDGSIYWLEDTYKGGQILAMDLHTEEFRDVKFLPLPYTCPPELEILNLDDRLALSLIRKSKKMIDIYCMVDLKEEIWSKTYSICLAQVAPDLPFYASWWFTPLMVSKEGNVLMCDNRNKNLFKHNPSTNITRRLSSSTCLVISPYLENLVRLNI